MKKSNVFLASSLLILSGCMQQPDKPQGEVRSPSEIMNAATQSNWRDVDKENILRITLETGHVYVELNERLAPNHVNNIKLLAREQFYNGLSIYRFVEGFVAQGGDQTDTKIPQQGKKRLDAELSFKTQSRLPITALDGSDGYAIRTGFLDGFAVGQNRNATKTWMTHCTGAFAMARGNEINSGGTEFYITLSPQRYLDRNITVFGRVLEGMEHVQKLQRQPTSGRAYNPILSVDVLADLSGEDSTQFEVFDTSTQLFQELIAARTNRPEPWFKFTPNYADVCSVAVPTRRKTM
ncbi:peptidylprolyl isomerase [Pseudoalteromonas luteoviolacea]|uniref:peptidylprolyl isomerase n=1 Tax=Pseudoalteromonas luteoviolacea TaxID=43657 RepID=UPI001B36F191|nr:peptidylprolyl isomerase [Pseudoalteromonas luteoviolacea]MBQ4814317.1 peptidylprolyl isomerase [Pseudoalteromonas luteoviolacea]